MTVVPNALVASCPPITPLQMIRRTRFVHNRLLECLRLTTSCWQVDLALPTPVVLSRDGVVYVYERTSPCQAFTSLYVGSNRDSHFKSCYLKTQHGEMSEHSSWTAAVTKTIPKAISSFLRIYSVTTRDSFKRRPVRGDHCIHLYGLLPFLGTFSLSPRR